MQFVKNFTDSALAANISALLMGPAIKQLNDVDEKLTTCFLGFQPYQEKSSAILKCCLSGPSCQHKLWLFQIGFPAVEHLSVALEQIAASCLLTRTLKCHRVVAINMDTAGT